jgi:low temperature requirement protein LtrA
VSEPSVVAEGTSVPEESGVRVGPLELFFDLVFVFTITQLTALLADHLTWRGGAQVVLMLSLLMWMYGGYAWLTNAISPNSPARRTLVLMGMAGFLTISLGIPDAFGATGWAFGVGYFVVNAVHTGLFIVSGGAGVVRAFRRLGPLNLISATLILVGGFTPEAWRWGLWIAAAVVQFAAPYLNPISEFRISPGHFVERHGLLIIIVLGESLIAIGIGAAGLELTAVLLATAVLSFVVAYLIWWVYFGGSMETAERAFAAVEPRRRALAAIHAFGWAHLPMFLGIVAVAAGIKKAVAHADEHLHLPEAAILGVGLAAFLLGDVAFRRLLHIPSVTHRAVAAVVVLAVVPGAMVAGVLGLAAAVVVLSLMLYLEDRARGLSWGDRRAWTAPTEP